MCVAITAYVNVYQLQKLKDELAARIRIPYDWLLVGRHLMKTVVPIHVSMDNPWTLDRRIIKCALRQAVRRLFSIGYQLIIKFLLSAFEADSRRTEKGI